MSSMLRSFGPAVAVAAVCGFVWLSAAPRANHQHDTSLRTDPVDCADTSLKCASFATPAVDSHGRLWLVWAAGSRISVARSADQGRTFSAPVQVTRTRMELDTGPDARPQIVVDRHGRVIVGFSIFRDTRFNGQVLVARSVDDGATFTDPTPVTGDAASQRFLTLREETAGGLFAAWVDKRQAAAARASGARFAGASLAYAWSADGGATFSPPRIIKDEICECCRIGVGSAGPDRPVVLFRNIFAGERDHAVVTFADRDTPGLPMRVSADRWAIDGCPHHGPSLAVSSAGDYHVVWFTGGAARQGAYYSRSQDGGRTFSTPRALTAGGHPQRPFVAVLDSRVWVAWKEFDGSRTTVLVQTSPDSGATWSPPRVVAAAAGFSDHPLLVAEHGRMYLSWLTRAEGYRLEAIDP
jgi:BNR repeat-like domain